MTWQLEALEVEVEEVEEGLEVEEVEEMEENLHPRRIKTPLVNKHSRKERRQCHVSVMPILI